jgi:hypothetical protein
VAHTLLRDEQARRICNRPHSLDKTAHLLDLEPTARYCRTSGRAAAPADDVRRDGFTRKLGMMQAKSVIRVTHVKPIYAIRAERYSV